MGEVVGTAQGTKRRQVAALQGGAVLVSLANKKAASNLEAACIYIELD